MSHLAMLRTDEIISPPAFVFDDVQLARFKRAFEADVTPPLRVEKVRMGRCRVIDAENANLLEAARRAGKAELLCAIEGSDE